MSARKLTAKASREGARIALSSPTVGVWRPAVSAGALVLPGALVGHLEILGVVHPVHAPRDAGGIVLDKGGVKAAPVGFGDALVALDAEASPAAVTMAEDSAAPVDAAGGLVFRAPSAGRFYRRPSPDKAAFVEPGQEIQAGTTVCLIEVMKTFTRVTYGGEGLPERARVLAVVPDDESDLAAGDPILTLEPL